MELLHGDCLDLMRELPEKSVDMVLCDPPYGITRRNAWDVVIPMEPMWECIHRVVKANGAVVLFSKLPFACDLIQSNRKEFRYEWVWHKNIPVGFLNARRMPLCAHENILVFYGRLPKYNPQKWKGKPYHVARRAAHTTNYGYFKPCAVHSDGERFPVDVIKFNNGNNSSKIHPTQKPVDLLEYLVKTYTDDGETVLDFCMGSGSTGIACLNAGRDFIGIEKDGRYFQAAKERIEEAMLAAATVA